MFSTVPVLLALRNKVACFAFTQCDGAESKWDSNWDMKGENVPKGVRQIVLIRHGQYVQGVKGDEKRVLTELG